MKNLTKFFVAVAALFVGVSCSTDPTEDLGQQIVGEGQTVITVSTGESVLDTKTSLGGKVNGNYPIYWSEGDVLSLNGVKSSNIVIAENGKTATFTWEGKFDAPYCLAYPAGDKGTVTFAAEQSYVEGTFAQNAVPMIGYAAESVDDLTLQYLAGVLQFNVSGAATLASMIIETVDGTPIAGVFDCDFAEGTIKAQAGSRSSIEYSFGEAGLNIANGASFHVAVPAGKYDAVKVIMLDANGAAFEGTVRADGVEEEGVTYKAPIAPGQVREFTVAYKVNKNYTVIKDAASLAAFAKNAATVAEAVVLKDIDASSLAADWAPIEGFAGLLRGNGKTISGLTKPLFGELKGTVSNLTYEANVAPGAAASETDTSKNLVAIFANTTNGATLTSCTVKGSLTINNTVYVPTTNDSAGELWFAGFAAKSTSTVFSNCTNEAEITITQSMAPTDVPGEKVYGPYIIIGGISAYPISDCKFKGCVNKGSINYPDAGIYDNETCGYIGGIIGLSDSDTNEIDDCVNSANYTHTASYVRIFSIGGIAGKVSAAKSFSGCINRGAIATTYILSYGQMGGVVGSLSCTMSKCKNYGTVSFISTSSNNKKYMYIGGVVGASAGTTAVVDNCENIGEVNVNVPFYANAASTGYLYIGGVVGYDQGTTKNCTNFGHITSAGKRGGIPSSGSYNATGGICGRISNNALSNCTNKGSITYNVTAYSKAANYNQPQFIGGVVGFTAKAISDCHNEGNVILSATADVNTITMGGIAGECSGAITDSDNKGAVQMLGTINGEPTGKHDVKIGGIVGHVGGALTNVHNLEKGALTISGNFVVPAEKGDSHGGGWGSFGIGGVAGNAAVLHNNVSNAAPVTISSNVVAIPQTDAKNNYTMHPLCIAGVTGYMSNSASVDVTNSGKITISGTHSYNTVGLYVGGVYSRGPNNPNKAYTNFDNNGAIEISTKFANAVACNVGGIGGYNQLVKFVNCDNSGSITITDQAEFKSTLYVGGITACTTNYSKSGVTFCTMYDNCHNTGKIDVKTSNMTANLVVGGMAGYINKVTANTEVIKNCSNSGAVTVSGSNLTGGVFIGGLTGSQGSGVINVTTFTNSGTLSFTGTGSKNTYIGGIVGSASQDVAGYTGIKNTGSVIATGTSTENYHVGGLCGRVLGTMNGWIANATVTAPSTKLCGIGVGAPYNATKDAKLSACQVAGKVTRNGEAEVTLTAENFADYIIGIDAGTNLTHSGCTFYTEK